MARTVALVVPDALPEPPGERWESCDRIPPGLTASGRVGILPECGFSAPHPPRPLAARALYGEPYGFTPVMEAAVRYIDWIGGATVRDIDTLGSTAAVCDDSVIDRGIEQAIARVEPLPPPE